MLTVECIRWNSFCVFCILTLAASTLQAEEYDIHNIRPSQVGEQRKVEVMNHDIFRMGQVGSPLMVEDTRINFAGRVEVLDVNDDGQETELEVMIAVFTRLIEGELEELLPVGTVIHALATEDEPEFEIEGEAVAAEIAEFLAKVISLDLDEDYSDAVMGADDPREVGAKWPLIAEPMAEDIAENLPGLTPEDISGEVHFVELERVNGIDQVQIRIELEFETESLEAEEGQDFEMLNPHGSMTIDINYPLEMKRGVRIEEMSRRMSVVMRGLEGTPRAGEEIEFSAVGRRESWSEPISEDE